MGGLGPLPLTGEGDTLLQFASCPRFCTGQHGCEGRKGVYMRREQRVLRQMGNSLEAPGVPREG